MQYSLEFTKQLVEAADTLKGTGRNIEERKRAVLYLSLLSIEISLKYLLEKAGVFVKEIKKRRHDISALLLDLDGCEIETRIVSKKKFVPATGIRSLVVNPAFAGATVGSLLEAELKGASKYPNEVRYGALPKHFPPDLMLECAFKVIEWAEWHGDTIRVKSTA